MSSGLKLDNNNDVHELPRHAPNFQENEQSVALSRANQRCLPPGANTADVLFLAATCAVFME